MKRCFLSPLNGLHGKFHSTVIFKAFSLVLAFEIIWKSDMPHTQSTRKQCYSPFCHRPERWIGFYGSSLLDFITSSPMNSISLLHAPAFKRNFQKEGTEHSCILRKVCLLRSCSFANLPAYLRVSTY